VIEFIFGAAGSGKTYAMVEEIRAELARDPEGPALIWLLPEQATFQAETALLAAPGPVGATRVHVLSFKSLALRVREHQGAPDKPLLSAVGRLFLLSRVYARAAPALAVFPREMRRGDLEHLTALLAELMRHGWAPEALRRSAEALEGQPLGGKLRDCALLLEAYQAELAATHQDPDLILGELAAMLARSEFAAGARVWVDGFAGLSGQERKVLRALARRAAAVKISLLMDPAADGGDLYAPVAETHRRLGRDFEEEGLAAAPPVVLRRAAPRFGKTPELLHLAAHLFTPGARPYAGPVAAIELIPCATPRAEADAAARAVLALVAERGLRYRDIAIIVRALDPWHDLLAAVLAEHRIPYFIDRRRTLRHHPLAELAAALGEALGDSFSSAAVGRALKTGLLPLDAREADVLENYVLRCNLRGDLWWQAGNLPGMREVLGGGARDAWLEEAEGLVARLAAALAPWRAWKNAAAPAEEWARRLYEFTRDIGALQKLLAIAAEAEDAGEPDRAREHRRAVENFMALLDEIARTGGTEPLGAADFFEFLGIGLQGWDMGLTPPRCDQVLVGAIERSRHPELKAVIIAGFNEGQFPRAVQEDPLLSDAERAALAEAGFALDGDSLERAREERLLASIALTRASEHLCITWSEKDQEGAPLFPSVFLGELRALFPALAPAPQGDALLGATTPERVVEGCLAGGPDGARFEALRAALAARPELAARAENVARAALIPPAPETVPWSGDAPIDVTVTDLESFARCPFQFFASRRLRLEEREEFDLGALELGTLAHRMLEWIGRRFMDEGPALGDLEADACARLAAEAAEAVLGKEGRAALERDPLLGYRAARCVEDIAVFLRARGRIERQGAWRPRAVEWEFKRGKGGAPLGFERDGRTFAVQGKIDRIDLSEEGPPLLCVYDFKSAARFTLDAIYHGLSLQLPLYLEALRLNARQVAGREAAVCGALFHATRAGLQAADGPVEEPDAEAIPPRFKPRGLLSLTGLRRFEPKLSGGSAYFRGSIKKDGALGARRSSDILEDRELDRLLERVGAVTGELLAAMAGGRAAAVPALHRRATACSRCRFGAVCRFERFGPGERYARHATLGVEEVLAALGAAPAREGGRG
jgi:ATP-dependent helicase/nuclease subunit B